MSDTPTHPVRPPALGPAVVLDLGALWYAVEGAMEARGMLNGRGGTIVKHLCELTGLDRNSVGRIRNRARSGSPTINLTQRGGISVNTYLTLAAFAAGTDLTPGSTPVLCAPFGIRNTTTLPKD